MPAFNMDNGRHAFRAPTLARATESQRPVTGVKVTVKLCRTDETANERRARHAQATGTTRGMWK